MSETDTTEELAEGTLLSHLIELRTRLLKMFGAVIGVFVVLVPFANRIFSVVAVLFLPPTLVASIYGMNFGC